MSWQYNGENFTSEMIGNSVGFVYIIINKLNNKKYIGKKRFNFVKYKQVKKKRKKLLVESDWMCYHGSCEELQADVSKFGEENFERVILRLCDSLAECTYFEAKYQFENDVILKPDEYYNSWISCRCRSNHLKKLIGNMEYEKMLCI